MEASFAPPASLLSLPEHIWGLLYSLLDLPSRKAFRASSPAIKNAPSVLQEIRTLRVDKELLHGVKQGSPHPLLCVPNGARIRTLIVHGSVGMGGVRHYDENGPMMRQEDGPCMMQLFHHSDEQLRLRVAEAVAQVEELVLQGCCLKAKDVATALGSSFCKLFPCLRTLKVEPAEDKTWGRGFPMLVRAPIHEALLTALSGSSIRELNLLGIKDLTNEHHVAIGSLTSLNSLSISLPEPIFAAEVPHLTFGALPNLRHLTVFSCTKPQYTRLKQEISKCTMLETLDKPLSLHVGMILSIPITLKMLTVEEISFSDLLLLLNRSNTSLHRLELLRADSLGARFIEGSGGTMGGRLSEGLAAVHTRLHLEFTSLSLESSGSGSLIEAMEALAQVSGTSLTNSIQKLQVVGRPCMMWPLLLEKLATICPNIKEIDAPAACLVPGGSYRWVQQLSLRRLSLWNCSSCNWLSDVLLPLCLAAQLDPHRTCKLRVALDGGKGSMYQAWESMKLMLKPITGSKVEWDDER